MVERKMLLEDLIRMIEDLIQKKSPEDLPLEDINNYTKYKIMLVETINEINRIEDNFVLVCTNPQIMYERDKA